MIKNNLPVENYVENSVENYGKIETARTCITFLVTTFFKVVLWYNEGNR